MKECNTVVKVERLPACNFCGRVAIYDGRTKEGPWAYMCERCFPVHGKGLGLGKGQKLEITKDEQR